MLGGKESLNTVNFTPEKFEAAYIEFINKMRALPTQPLVFLMSPTNYPRNMLNKFSTTFKLN
jgi:hypothetical protein